MTTTALVWLVIGLLTVVAVLALLIALIRHVLVLGRAARRFQEEVTPIAEDISALSDRASSRPKGLRRGPGSDR
jgi:Na+-transporting methylmalonyl-CoA/oxaloacetate decarboxylase gamma subunit